MVNNFQRVGAPSNTRVGIHFENLVKDYFLGNGVELHEQFSVPIGLTHKKERKFDLGSPDLRVLIECRSHKWTSGRNVPSAKMTSWNEAMYYFLLAPSGYRKMLVVLRDYSQKRGETLADYYIKTYRHLIPDDVEIWEVDECARSSVRKFASGRVLA